MATTVTITYTKPAAGAVVIDPTDRQESSVFINPTGMPLNNNNSLYGVDLRNEEHYKDLNTDAGIIKIPAFKRWASHKIDTNEVAAGATATIVINDATAEAGLYYTAVIDTLTLAGVLGLSIALT